MSTPLTLEKMRADIAQAVDLEPSDLGDHDNIYDLGLDSMRLMSLVLAWSEAGCALDYGVLSEDLTLAAWWAEAQRIQSGH